MKKRIIPALCLCLLLLGGCYFDMDNTLSTLERRITSLENRCNQMNETLKGLREMVEALQKYDFISKVEPVYQGGNTVAYTIYFTHSSPITVYNGTDADTPLLGVDMGEDGNYYWTVKYPGQEPQFVLNNYGRRIATAAVTPILKIENGNWMVTYDGGQLWSTLGKATGEDGVSFFRSVVNQGDYYQFNMVNGTTIELPIWDRYVTIYNALKAANENLKSFTELASSLTSKVYADNIIPIVSGSDTTGYSLHLSNGNTYRFYNGTGTNVPQISARPLTSDPADKVYYWSIRYSSTDIRWLLDDKGNRIRANAPEGKSVKLDLLEEGGKYYWAVAYGDEKPQFLLLDGQKVLASAQAPDPVVTNVVQVGTSAIRITIGDSQTIDIPLRQALSFTFGSPVAENAVTMAASDTLTITCQISPASDKTSVLPVASDDFYATSAPTSPDYTFWRIDIISPASFKSGSSKLNILVSDGEGTMKTVVLTVNYKEKEK